MVLSYEGYFILELFSWMHDFLDEIKLKIDPVYKEIIHNRNK